MSDLKIYSITCGPKIKNLKVQASDYADALLKAIDIVQPQYLGEFMSFRVLGGDRERFYAVTQRILEKAGRFSATPTINITPEARHWIFTKPRGPRGPYFRGGKTDEMLDLLMSGMPCREAARKLGMAVKTARRHRAELVKACGEIYCKCGLVSSHRGWCSVRYKNSHSRQAFMQKWHQSSCGLAMSAS